MSGIIAGHGHGTGDRSGIIGIAPAARILSVRVTLEFNDPLSSDATISRRLPQAIADGITYAVAHGARIIDLPLDPGTLGMTGQGDPAAAAAAPPSGRRWNTRWARASCWWLPRAMTEWARAS